jgi:hypothetical protein
VLIAQRGPVQGECGGLSVAQQASQAVQRYRHAPPRTRT